MGVVARRRWAAVPIFKEEFLDGSPCPTPTPTHQIILKARKHQWDNSQAVGPHYTNPTHTGFLRSSDHSWQGCVK